MTPYCAATLIQVVRPIFGQWTGDVVLTVHVIAFAVWAVCMRLNAASTDELEKLLGLAVLDGLDRAHITVKEAASLMKWDENHFRQAIRYEKSRHISLTRLVRLPLSFWVHFLPVLTALVVRRNVLAMAEDLGLRRSA
jgi:hypothetical protein